MSTKSGGFAFPTHFNGNSPPDNGMTLRDYFAAKAMQSMLAGICDPSVNAEKGLEAVKIIGDSSYEIADLMLKGRAK